MAQRQKYPHLIGSQWTALTPTLGWRHFRVVNRQAQGRHIFAELVAACDPHIRLWINVRSLYDPALWQPGWRTQTSLGLGPALETVETSA
jgi:tryptophan-rich hypothetical protein